VKVDRQVVALAAQPPDERDVGAQASRRARTPRHDYLIEVRIVTHDGGGFLFDDVSEAGVRVAATDGSDGRCREDDVADQSEANQQNIQMPIYFSIAASSISITGMSSLIG
jgi:hypothetical protein